MKKFITIAAMAAFLTVGTASANAATVEELQAQIALLMEQLNGTSATTSATPYNHVVTLKVGSRGTQVSQLQACMNALGYSTGTVDGIFGMNTKSGVMQFQAAKGLAVDGIIGPATGPQFEMACNGTVVVVEDDEDDVDAGEFPVSGGEEASLEDFNLDSEDDAEEGKEAHVATIEFDVEDGDIMIERLDLTFADMTSGTADDEPWDVFETLTLMVDGDEIASEDIDDEDDWKEDNDPFVFRLSGLEYVVEEGDTAEIEVYLTAQDNVDDITNADWDIYVDTNGIRGVDTAGITQYIGDASDKVSVEIEAEGGDEDIKIKSSNNDLDSSLLKVDEDEEEWYEVFLFELEAEENDITVDELEVEVILTNVDYNTAINDMKVEMNGNEVDDFDVYDVEDTNRNGVSDGGENAFDYLEVYVVFDIDEEFEIDGDDEEEVTVSVEFKKADQDNDGTTDGVFDTTTVKTIQVGARSVDGEGVDDVDDTSTLNGKVHTLTFTSAEITNIDWAITESQNSANGTIDFFFTVDNSDSDEDFDVEIASILDTVGGATFQDTAGTPETGDFGVLSRVTGDSVTPIGTTGFTVDEGDTVGFRVRYTANAAGTYEVSISEVAGVELDDADELSPSMIL